ncbi:MAG: hypothetical protein ACRDSJ_22450 [Rubrobacteraceae bacterium]
MDLKRTLLSVLLVFALAACGDTEEGQEDTTAPDGEQTSEEQTMREEATMAGADGDEMVGEGEVAVGGFVVESPGVPEQSVPEVVTDPESVNEYLGQVRPVVDDTVRDITGLIDPEVRFEDGGVSLDLNATSLEEAEQSVQNGADRLREMDTPEELEPINDQLIEAYERAQPAYRDVAEAAQSGDPEQLDSVVNESLPQIQAFNAEVSGIIQDLEQASDES